MKVLQIFWNDHHPYYLQSSGKVKRINGILKLKISKLAQTTGLPWPNVFLLVLLTVHSTRFGKHKLTPYETVTGKPISIGIKPSSDPWSHASVTSCCRSLMSYVQAYYQQDKEAFPDPNSKDTVGPSLEPGDWVC